MKQHYRVERIDQTYGEAYWVSVRDEDTARRAVAWNTDAKDATDPAKYECQQDQQKQPPEGFIHRRLNGPLAVQRQLMSRVV